MRNVVRFDCFEVDLDAGQLRKRGTRIKLRDQSFQVLASLLEQPGRVVTREELRRRLWHDDVFVDFENNLNIVVGRLRAALSDCAERPRFIETLPKRGYRFVGTVSEPAKMHAVGAGHAKLLVLPFANLSGDSSRDYFSDALTDEIITALASLSPARLAVIARVTAMHYRDSRKNAADIGGELGVDYIVEGAVRHTDGHASLNLQLIETRDQTHLFARKYEADMREAFALLPRIAQELCAHIPGVTDDHRATARIGGRPKSTEHLMAYKEYLEGRKILDGAKGQLEQCKRHMERAVALDAEFAHAHDGLAESYWYLGYMGYMPPRQAFAAGIVHALRALEIDNTRAETHALLGQFHKIAEYNWGEVAREMASALRLNPNSPVVRTRYAVSGLMPHGRVQEAAEELRRALDLDPLSLLPRVWLGIALVLGRRFEEAIVEARRVLELDPTNYGAYFVLGASFAYQRKFDDAIAAHRTAVERLRGTSGFAGWLGLTLALGGKIAEARDLLSRLEQKRTNEYVPATSIAWIHLGLRNIDAAFDWMDRAVNDCDQFMMPVKTYGFLDPLRSDPRYTALLRKMNLAGL